MTLDEWASDLSGDKGCLIEENTERIFIFDINEVPGYLCVYNERAKSWWLNWNQLVADFGLDTPVQPVEVSRFTRPTRRRKDG